MFTKKYQSVRLSRDEVTPESVYLNRRQFMKGMAALGVGTLLAACSGSGGTPAATTSVDMNEENGLTDEFGDPDRTRMMRSRAITLLRVHASEAEVDPVSQGVQNLSLASRGVWTGQSSEDIYHRRAPE